MPVIKICFSLELRRTAKWPSLKLQLSSTQDLSRKAIRILLKRLLASPSGEQGRTFKGCLQIVQENVGGHVNVGVHVYLAQVSVFLGMSMGVGVGPRVPFVSVHGKGEGG